jgi:hypothetical protein
VVTDISLLLGVSAAPGGLHTLSTNGIPGIDRSGEKNLGVAGDTGVRHRGDVTLKGFDAPVVTYALRR